MNTASSLSLGEDTGDSTESLQKTFSGQCPDGNPPSGKSLSADSAIQSHRIIFLGNGPLAESALAVLREHTNIIFHARNKSDLDTVKELKLNNPDAHAVLASFGVLIKSDLLELFEPEGILNLHPSLLPLYRGPSPIESAILAGDSQFGYSIMKLAKAMDAGPIYHQATLDDIPLDKSTIYHDLATAGATWIIKSLNHLGTPNPQDNSKATYTQKLDKSDSFLQPDKFPAETIYRQIIAFQGFPKPKYDFYGKTCIILDAHVVEADTIICDPSLAPELSTPLMLKCADRNFVAIDRLQPAGKKPMDVKSFINGYAKI